MAVWARRCLPGIFFTFREDCAAACEQARRSAGRIPSTATGSASCRNSRSVIPAKTIFSSCIEGLQPVIVILDGTLLHSMGVNAFSPGNSHFVLNFPSVISRLGTFALNFQCFIIVTVTMTREKPDSKCMPQTEPVCFGKILSKSSLPMSQD